MIEGIGKRFIAPLLAASSLLVAGAGHAQSAFQLGVGIHVGQNRNALQATQTALARVGFNSFRDEVFWHRLETQPGVLTFPDSLRDLDELVTESARQGRRPLLILDYGNKLYDGGGQLSSSAGIAAYARYVRFIVKHFRGRVDQFEVWNEWNIGGGGTAEQRAARHGSPEAYSAVLRAAYAAVKAENPGATVIGGAFAGYDYRWIEAFARADGFKSLDAFSIHPYVFAEGVRAPRAPAALTIGMQRLLSLFVTDAVAADPFKPLPGTPESAMSHIDEFKQRIDQLAPGRNLRIYVTEAGWPVQAGSAGVSEETAAAYVQRFMLLAKVRPWIAGVWWYDLFDDGDDARNKEHRFGLMSKDGVAKPAFQALLDMKPMILSNVRPTEQTDGSGQVTVTGQRADGKPYVVKWLATSVLSQKQAAGSLVLDGKPVVLTDAAESQ